MAGPATEAAIASARITSHAMDGIAQMVTSTFNRATQERQLQVNILEGMVQSAQNAKQMEVDSFFKTQELQLRGKELDINSKLRNAQLGYENTRLTLAERGIDLQEDRFRLEEKKVVEADKYKPYMRVLSEEAAMKDRDLKSEERFLEEKEKSLITEIHGREKSGANSAIRGMTARQKLDDEQNPNGKISELKKIQTERRKALESKRTELEDIQRELVNVSNGNAPGRFRPLPKGFGSVADNSFYDETEDASDPYASNNTRENLLLPNSNFSQRTLIPENLTDTEKAKRVLEMEELDSLERLEGSVPEYNEQQPIAQEDESKIIAKQDARYMSGIFDPSVPLDEVPELIDGLSPAGKLQLEKRKGIYESGFLADYGAAKSFDSSKPYNPDSKASEQMSEMYARSGGDPIELNLLRSDAETKLITLRAEANALASKDDADKAFDVNVFVANGYNKWVSDRLIKKEEVANNNVSSGIKTGSVIAPDGSLPGFRRIASTETKDESLDDLLGKYTVSAEDRKIKEKEDKDIELYDQFSKGFIKTEGGFDRRTFAETALQQPSLLYAVLGNERVNFEASEVGYSDAEVEAVTNANYRKLIEKTKKLNAPDAFKMWKEASKFIK